MPASQLDALRGGWGGAAPGLVATRPAEGLDPASTVPSDGASGSRRCAYCQLSGHGTTTCPQLLLLQKNQDKLPATNAGTKSQSLSKKPRAYAAEEAPVVSNNEVDDTEIHFGYLARRLPPAPRRAFTTSTPFPPTPAPDGLHSSSSVCVLRACGVHTHNRPRRRSRGSACPHRSQGGVAVELAATRTTRSRPLPAGGARAACAGRLGRRCLPVAGPSTSDFPSPRADSVCAPLPPLTCRRGLVRPACTPTAPAPTTRSRH